MLVAIGLVVLAVASLALPRDPARQVRASALPVNASDADVASPRPGATAQRGMSTVTTVATPAPLDDQRPIAVKAPPRIDEKPGTAREGRAARKASGESIPPAAAPVPVAPKTAAGESADVIAPAATTSASPAAPAAAADTSGSTDVTITGCLEIATDGKRFRLTDTEGAGVPKARSWRSGFLKKRPAPIELVGLGDPPTAKQFVGQRVVATGPVEDREMQVRSLQAAGGACSQ